MSLRVSESYLSATTLAGINRNLRDLARAQLQATTMRRVNSYADDPRAVAAISRLHELLVGNDQYLRNIDRSRSFVIATDSALQSMSTALADVRVLLQQETSALASADSRRHAAGIVDELAAQFMDMLNTEVQGSYIFGGHRTDVPPFVLSGDDVQYQGDDGLISVQVGPSTTLAINLPGSAFMGTGNSTLVGAVSLAPNLRATDLLADLDGGAGWREGAFRIADGAGRSYTVDLTGAVTVGDVLSRIDAAGGGDLVAGIHADGTGLQISGTGPLTVSEIDDGRTAASLGLAGTSSSGLLVGRDVRTQPQYDTPLARIPALAGKLPLGGIVLEVGGTQTAVDLSTANTIGDLRALIGMSVPDLDLVLEGPVLSLVSGTTEPFRVLSAEGDATAADLGLVGSGTPARLFGMLADLKESLLADDTTGLRQAMIELEALEQLVQGRLTQVGGKQNSLDWIEGLLREREERLATSLSLERDADMARVATDMSRAEAAYQSSLLVTSRLFQTNLMQYLR